MGVVLILTAPAESRFHMIETAILMVQNPDLYTCGDQTTFSTTDTHLTNSHSTFHIDLLLQASENKNTLSSHCPHVGE